MTFNFRALKFLFKLSLLISARLVNKSTQEEHYPKLSLHSPHCLAFLLAVATNAAFQDDRFGIWIFRRSDDINSLIPLFSWVGPTHGCLRMLDNQFPSLGLLLKIKM